MTHDQRDVEEALTGPGGEFEVAVEDVAGRPLRVYRSRHRSLREMLQQGLVGGEKIHIGYGDRRLSFRHAVRSANSVSRGLRALGLRPGDRVAVFAANSPEWIATFWGAVSAGSVLVGLNGWWGADEAVYALQDCGARILVVDRPRWERIKDRLSECSNLEHVLLVGVSASGVRSFDELLAHPADEMLDVGVDEDDPAAIFYTSGTTGRPRGVVHSHRAMIASAQNIRFGAAVAAKVAGTSTPATPTALVTVPFFHVSGCHAGFVAAMDRGSMVVLSIGRFDPEQVLDLIEREHVTQWSTVPTMVQRVIDHTPSRPHDTSSLTSIGYGGAPSGAELQRRALAAFPSVRGLHIGYGLTETSGSVAINRGVDLDRAPEAAGRALPIVELRISASPLANGESGEVCVRSSQSMTGYWPLGSDTALTEDGWFCTGDIGYLDAEAVLHLTGRAKDVIIRGGENVACAEIENRLAAHPAIAEAAVIGVSHPSLGEEVGAVVLPRPGMTVTADDARQWVAASLARFKVPVHVWITDRPLPRNAAGKLLKADLRTAFVAGMPASAR